MLAIRQGIPLLTISPLELVRHHSTTDLIEEHTSLDPFGTIYVAESPVTF